MIVRFGLYLIRANSPPGAPDYTNWNVYMRHALTIRYMVSRTVKEGN